MMIQLMLEEFFNPGDGWVILQDKHIKLKTREISPYTKGICILFSPNLRGCFNPIITYYEKVSGSHGNPQ